MDFTHYRSLSDFFQYPEFFNIGLSSLTTGTILATALSMGLLCARFFDVPALGHIYATGRESEHDLRTDEARVFSF